MTVDQPDAGALLDLSRRILGDEILPATPAEHTLGILMVMRTLEIASRTLGDSADGLEHRHRERIERLIGRGGDAATLAARIRNGEWDADRDARALHAVLVEDARDRLARVNPKYLAVLDSERR